ncbi:MAG TPA: hypothetical protein VEF06_15215 [Bryobacteraceae bacterium]|nr:hypothetical protein [Bryobacteraceae bacterium]
MSYRVLSIDGGGTWALIPVQALIALYGGDREIPLDREIVLFCTCPNEVTAAKAALVLRKYGITRVRPLVGGADAWAEVQSVPR